VRSRGKTRERARERESERASDWERARKRERDSVHVFIPAAMRIEKRLGSV